MKKIPVLLMAFTILSMKPAKKIKIIFFGDSITRMGINKGGFIDRMQTALNERKMEKKYELIGAGVGGNKVYDLYLRMKEDVIDNKPSLVVIYVGVNDVWHKTSGTGTEIDKFEKFYVAIIKKLKAKKIKVVVVTPLCIGELKNKANPQDADLNNYSEVIRKIATTYECSLADLRELWLQYEEKNNSDNKEQGLLTTDRVHLTETGNQLVADALMKIIDIH